MRILIIDDEPLVAKTLSRLLRPHDVQMISSGSKALASILAEEYSLIFCDLMMPDISGQALYGQVMAEKPESASKFVFITGGASNSDTVEFLESQPIRVLYKPFDRSVLNEILATAEARA